MTTTDIGERRDLASKMITSRAGSGGLYDPMNRELALLQATLETAFQLAKLNEHIETGATITIRPALQGRKFRA